MDSTTDGKTTLVASLPQEATGTEEGLNVLDKGTSRGTLVSTTGSTGDSQDQGKKDDLLTGGLAVALSGHWRAAETQFVDTARRVRRKFWLSFWVRVAHS